MTRLLCLVLVTTLTALQAQGAIAEPVTAARGVWAGVMGERSSAWATPPGRVELRLDGSDKRFTVNLSSAGAPLLVGEFQSGKRDGVFGPPEATGLMAFFGFGRGGTVNPLAGEPMVWARRAGEELVFYNVIVRDGAYRLERLVVTPAGDRLRVAFERREHGKPPERFIAQLERQRP